MIVQRDRTQVLASRLFIADGKSSRHHGPVVANIAPIKKILVIDIGGTSVKILASGHKVHRSFSSGPKMTPKQMVSGVKNLAADWAYDVLSIGYPGPVLRGWPIAEPHNLRRGWVGFDFVRAFRRPVKIVNDAAMQALGSYRGGKMLFLGLGTGLGSCMIVDGIVEPMELGHLPYKKGTYEDYVGSTGLKRHGKKKWRQHVADVVSRLVAALEPDDTVIGGGNVRKLDKLPKNARAGDNANAFLGGFRLWQDESPRGPEIAKQLREAKKSHASSESGRGGLALNMKRIAATKTVPVVFLFDVDNTLLDNDRVQADLKEHLEQAYGVATRDRYWEILEQLRNELGYVDYLGALERYRREAMHRPELLRMSSWLVDYPFVDRLYSGALGAVKHVEQWGIPVILSDGDAVFQPRKVERSGLWQAFGGRVLIYVHKEQELADVERLYPADHYVLIDDKLRILAAVKDIWSKRVTTVFPKQGHYALDPDILAEYPPADIEIAQIGALANCDLPALLRDCSALRCASK